MGHPYHSQDLTLRINQHTVSSNLLELIECPTLNLFMSSCNINGACCHPFSYDKFHWQPIAVITMEYHLVINHYMHQYEHAVLLATFN